MQEFGKIDFLGNLIFAPNTIQIGTELIINPTREQYLSAGYKCIIFDDELEPKEGYNTERYYEQTEDTIYVRYRYVENEEEEPTPDEGV
jgi:hypothetical protein